MVRDIIGHYGTLGMVGARSGWNESGMVRRQGLIGRK